LADVLLPYSPRKAFLPFHDRTKRWACLVAHRRAGKTVAAVNDIIRAAVMYTGPNGLFGYVAPYQNQARRIAWDYFKWYAEHYEGGVGFIVGLFGMSIAAAAIKVVTDSEVLKSWLKRS